ncbi:MAG: phage/plasmid primase, P4 family [Acidimicrobiales bacterium]|nr:phage/plasmid primase, P4 family [Acidimicrobiales bacterium]
MTDAIDHHAHTQRFLNSLLQTVPEDSGLYAYSWCLNGKRTRTLPLSDSAGLASLNNGTNPLESTYFGMSLVAQPLGRRERATHETAAGITALWLDIDVAGEAHQKSNLPPDRDAAVEIIHRLGVPPTMTVWSGYGIHGYWVLTEPLLIMSERDRAAVASLCSGWVGLAQDLAGERGYTLDSVGDLARVLRLPGSLNLKVPTDPRLAEVLDDSGPLYEATDLADLIGARRRSNPSTPPPGAPDEPDSFTLDPLADPPEDRWKELRRRPQVLAAFNSERPELQSQSERDLSLASSALRAGWSDQEIVDLLVAARRHVQAPLKIKRPDYYRRTLHKARASSAADPDGADDAQDGGLLEEIAQRGSVPVLADLAEDDRFFAVDDGGQLHLFEGGVYRPAGEFVRLFVRDTLADHNATKVWRAKLAGDVVAYLAPGLPRLTLRPSLTHLNVTNGLVELSTNELKPHDPHLLTKIQLPVAFNAEAVCPAWDEFISQVFPPDATHVAYELVAFAMVPDPSIQKAILLLGGGGEGKSTFLSGLTAFLGRGNVSTETLQRLEGNRFAGSRLDGKLANIAADLPAKELEGSDVLKGVTGGDVMTAERKFEAAYDYQPHVRLIFSANQAPRTPDPSQAFFDRWIVIRFARRFRDASGEIPRSVLDARLAAPGELSGLLNRALAALPDVLSRGIDEPESLQVAKAEFREATDPLSVWLDRCVEAIPEGYIAKVDLAAAYNLWAARHGHAEMSVNAFGRAIRRARPLLKGSDRRVGGRRQEVWLGIARVHPEPQTVDETGQTVSSIVTRLRSNDVTSAGSA